MGVRFRMQRPLQTVKMAHCVFLMLHIAQPCCRTANLCWSFTHLMQIPAHTGMNPNLGGNAPTFQFQPGQCTFRVFEYMLRSSLFYSRGRNNSLILSPFSNVFLNYFFFFPFLNNDYVGPQGPLSHPRKCRSSAVTHQGSCRSDGSHHS